jgi:hypothetical protein
MKLVSFCMAVLLLCSCGDDVTGPSGSQGWSLVSVWGSRGSGPGRFWDLYQFSVDPGSGNVYLPDWGNGRVQYLDREGNFLGEWEIQFEGWSIDVSSQGEVLLGNHTDSRVARYGLDGGYIGEWGEWGTGPGQFEELAWIRVLPDGRVAVLDLWADQVQVYGNDGVLVDEWTVPDMVYGDSPYIDAMDATPSGNLLLLSPELNTAWEFTSGGSLVGSRTFAFAEPWMVAGIASDPQGRVFIGFEEEPKIRIFDSQWNQTGSITFDGLVPGEWSYSPDLLEVDSEGRLLVLCTYGVNDLRMVVLQPE